MCITVSGRDMCFWDSRPCPTKCEKNGKAYLERVPGSEQGFEHSPNMRIWLFIEHVVGEQYVKHSLFCKFLLLFFQLSHMKKDIRLSPLFPTLIDVKLGEACERG